MPPSPIKEPKQAVAPVTPTKNKLQQDKPATAPLTPIATSVADSQDMKKISKSGEIPLSRELLEEEAGYLLQVDVFGVEEVGTEIADQLREVIFHLLVLVFFSPQ